MWRDFYQVEYAVNRDVFYSRMRTEQNEYYYNLPISKHYGFLTKNLGELVDYDRSSIRFATVPGYMIKNILENNKVISVEEQTDFADYIYDLAELSSFTGRKYSGQRNHVNYFMKTFPNWSFELLNDNNKSKVRRFFLENYMLTANHGPYEDEENKRVLEVLDNSELYGMIGGVLQIADSVVGFTIIEIIANTMFTHVEKADKSIRGAYQMLVQQAAIHLSTHNVKLINREEDMGDLGLRTSKLSYHPINTIQKYVVEVAK